MLYRAPLRAGPLRVVRVEGTLLTLEAANGQLIGFDAATQQFVGQPTAPAPTQVLPNLPDLYSLR